MDKIFSLGVPVKTFELHHHILPFLDKYKVDRLYQVDFHSDIANEPITKKELNEGTWANFYKHRNTCTFEWRYPSTADCFDKGSGRCDLASRWHKSIFSYQNTVRRQGLSNIDWGSIKAVAIVLSRNWWYGKDMSYLVERYL